MRSNLEQKTKNKMPVKNVSVHTLIMFKIKIGIFFGVHIINLNLKNPSSFYDYQPNCLNCAISSKQLIEVLQQVGLFNF